MGANTVVWYKFGTLMQHNQPDWTVSIASSHRLAVYDEGPLAVPGKDYARYALQRQFKTAFKHSVWIFPAPFVANPLINDA